MSAKRMLEDLQAMYPEDFVESGWYEEQRAEAFATQEREEAEFQNKLVTRFTDAARAAARNATKGGDWTVDQMAKAASGAWNLATFDLEIAFISEFCAELVRINTANPIEDGGEEVIGNQYVA